MCIVVYLLKYPNKLYMYYGLLTEVPKLISYKLPLHKNKR